MVGLSSNSSCLSGAAPIQLTSSFHCNLGFYCPNNSALHPPEFCAPTASCQATRLESPSTPCVESQGLYQPVVCPPGKFCPQDGREMLSCPKGSYCPVGTYDPFRCGLTSICPLESSRQFSLLGFIIIVAIDVVMGLLWWRDWRKLRSKNRRSDVERTSSQETLCSSDDDASVKAFMASFARCVKTSNIGLSFAFSDLTYRPKSMDRDIVSAISGGIEKGSMWAVMGPSGSGKSTFVDLLMGNRIPSNGSISVNGGQAERSKYSKLIGYVPQDDVLLPELTVRENILHSARIRLPRSWTEAQRNDHVDRLLDCLHLTHTQHRTVRNISGGERKRASIGIELIAGPMALFLDEPTSGLDSTSALSLVELLKALSQMGVTIVCIIHQPRREIFEVLDNVLVLKKGEQVFQGPREGIVPFFKNRGFSVSDAANPADAILDIVSERNPIIEPPQIFNMHGSKLVMDWEEYWKKALPPIPITVSDDPLPSTSGRSAPWLLQTYFCLTRALKQQQRQPVSFYLEIGVGAVAGLLIGLALYPYKGLHFQGLYLPPFELLSSAVDYKTVPMISLMCCMAIGLASASPGVRVFGDEKDTYQRETRSGHSRSAYYTGKLLSTIPRILLSSLHFTSFYAILATPCISFWDSYVTIALYFYAIYGLASLVSVVVSREDGPLFATILCLVISVLDGHGPPLATVHEWHLEWMWRMYPGTWFAEAWMDRFLRCAAHLYDVDKAAAATKWVLGRYSLDLGMVFIIGSVYRVLAFVGLVWAPGSRR